MRSMSVFRMVCHLILAGWAVSASHGTEVAPSGQVQQATGVRHANRILFHPITSFYINGVNGAYERRFAHGRLGMHVPFYLGRIFIEGQGAESTLGGGLGFDCFLSAAPGGGRLSVTAEGIDLKRHDIRGYGDNFDPNLPGSSQSRYDIYHQYHYNFTFTLAYRWEYPSRRFLADLALGTGYFGFRMPALRRDQWGYSQRSWEPPLAYQGFLPVAHFALGIPF